jgi:amidase
LYAHQWNANDIDAILCPANASVASAHDESRYWGYTCVFNALDYPAAILPIGTVEKTDTWSSFPPVSSERLNPLDGWHRKLYQDIEGPNRYEGAPVSLQIVGRRFHDEKLLRVVTCLRDLLDKTP